METNKQMNKHHPQIVKAVPHRKHTAERNCTMPDFKLQYGVTDNIEPEMKTKGTVQRTLK